MLRKFERLWWIPGFFGVILLSGCLFKSSGSPIQPTSTPGELESILPTEEVDPSLLLIITGRIVDADGPVSGAIVRVQATDLFTSAREDGSFSLGGDWDGNDEIKLTAWAPGYFCGGPVSAFPGDQQVEIEIHRHADADNPTYSWLPSLVHPGQGENQGCVECHSREGTTLLFTLPVDQWLLDAHAQSAVNPRFLSMYYGIDLDGNQSPVTRRAYSRDYGSFPIGPDLTQPYYGPGYKLDFPETAGNCAACHLPAAAVNDPYGIDPGSVSMVELEGTPCDFCHKVWDIQVDDSTDLPYPNMPGVLSMAFQRPPEGHQFFAGPYDDVAPGEDTYLAIQTESVFCASCHFGVFWDTVIYNSYGEWLSSPYSDPVTGKTCQDCHMPPTGATQFATDKAGGLTRDPSTIYSHRMLGAADVEFLQNSLTVEPAARLVEGKVYIDVGILNDNTGHKIPTDSPLRNLILVVQSFDSSGSPLDQISGPTIPEWGGLGDPGQGYYGGLPGKGYAIILEELWTGISPSGAYWNPVRVVSDTRLIPFELDESHFSFDAGGAGAVEVSIQLIYRRAFKSLLEQKNWPDEDILLFEQIYNLQE